MEVSDERSSDASGRLLFRLRGAALMPARGLDAFAQFHAGAPAGNFGHAAGHHVAFLVLGDVFVQAGGHQLLHAQAQAALRGIDFEHLRLHHLADLEHVLRMIDALLGADVAHVDHAFHALGQLHERAELR